MVGPSGHTWSVDTATGVPLGPVPEAEHRTVRYLMQRERLDIADPAWVRGADGQSEIVARVVAAYPVDKARAAVDDVTDQDEAPTRGYPQGCCISADDEAWWSG